MRNLTTLNGQTFSGVVEIVWNDTTSVRYGTDDSIDAILPRLSGNISAVEELGIDLTQSSNSISVEVFDVDYSLFQLLQANGAVNKVCRLHINNELFASGYVQSPVNYQYEKRLFQFQLRIKPLSYQTGFSVDEGTFPNSTMDNEPWPEVFGSPNLVPLLKFQDLPVAQLATPFVFQDQTLNLQLAMLTDIIDKDQQVILDIQDMFSAYRGAYSECINIRNSYIELIKDEDRLKQDVEIASDRVEWFDKQIDDAIKSLYADPNSTSLSNFQKQLEQNHNLYIDRLVAVASDLELVKEAKWKFEQLAKWMQTLFDYMVELKKARQKAFDHLRRAEAERNKLVAVIGSTGSTQKILLHNPIGFPRGTPIDIKIGQITLNGTLDNNNVFSVIRVKPTLSSIGLTPVQGSLNSEVPNQSRLASDVNVQSMYAWMNTGHIVKMNSQDGLIVSYDLVELENSSYDSLSSSNSKFSINDIKTALKNVLNGNETAEQIANLFKMIPDEVSQDSWRRLGAATDTFYYTISYTLEPKDKSFDNTVNMNSLMTQARNKFEDLWEGEGTLPEASGFVSLDMGGGWGVRLTPNNINDIREGFIDLFKGSENGPDYLFNFENYTCPVTVTKVGHSKKEIKYKIKLDSSKWVSLEPFRLPILQMEDGGWWQGSFEHEFKQGDTTFKAIYHGGFQTSETAQEFTFKERQAMSEQLLTDPTTGANYLDTYSQYVQAFQTLWNDFKGVSSSVGLSSSQKKEKKRDLVAQIKNTWNSINEFAGDLNAKKTAIQQIYATINEDEYNVILALEILYILFWKLERSTPITEPDQQYHYTSRQLTLIKEASPVILGHWLGMYQTNLASNYDLLPSSDTLAFGIGEPVYLASDVLDSYIVNIMPDTQVRMLYYEEDGHVYPIPTSQYAVGNVDFGSLQVTGLILPNNEYSIYADLTSPVGPNVVDIVSYIINRYTELTYDDIYDARTDLDGWPANFVLEDRKDALATANEIAWQARCMLLVKNGVASLKPLWKAYSPVATFSESNMQTDKNALLTFSDTLEITTKFVAEWRPNYFDDPYRLVHKINLGRYHEKEKVNPFYIYNQLELVKSASMFWAIRQANIWKELTFDTSFEFLNVEVGDTVTINLPNFLQVDGLVTSTTMEFNELDYRIRVQLPIRDGESDPYPFYHPVASGLYPTVKDIQNKDFGSVVNFDVRSNYLELSPIELKQIDLGSPPPVINVPIESLLSPAQFAQRELSKVLRLDFTNVVYKNEKSFDVKEKRELRKLMRGRVLALAERVRLDKDQLEINAEISVPLGKNVWTEVEYYLVRTEQGVVITCAHLQKTNDKDVPKHTEVMVTYNETRHRYEMKVSTWS